MNKLMAHKKGARAELLACAWLLGQNYTTFRNVGSTGAADLVAWRPGEAPILIDVKYLGKREGPIKSKYDDVRILYVTESKITFEFEELSNI